MLDNEYCVVYMKGHFDDFNVVSVSGPYTKEKASDISKKFGNPTDDSGHWKAKVVSKFNNKS